MIKINSSKLKRFIELVSINGRLENIELLFSEEGLRVYSKDEYNLNMCYGLLKKESFIEYNTIKENIGIKNSSMLIQTLGCFNDNVNIEIKENLFIIYNKNNKVKLVLINSEFIKNKYDIKEINIFDKFDEGFNIQSNLLKEALKYSNILKSNEIEINIKNNILNINCGDVNFDNISLNDECNYKDVRSIFGSSLFILIPLLDENINISIVEDTSPIQITLNNNDYMIKLLASSREE